MTPLKRHEQILEKLRIDGQVRVRLLASEFQVTEDCIRKDLAVLSAQKKLERIHGGAIPMRENPHALHQVNRTNLQEKEKEKIARKAFKLIQPGMTVFLDISSINLALARLIYESRMDVCVVTNMSGVMKIFAAPSSVHFVFLGGTLNHAHDGFAGPMTIEQIRHFHFDAAFLGSVGIDLFRQVISTSNPEDGLTKKAVLEQSSAAYLLAETGKLEQKGHYNYAGPRDFRAWICEKQPAQTAWEQAEAIDLTVL